VLGFGCSGVLGRSGRSESLRALSAAFDAGITFYDTARSYGYGESEALLGEFLRGRRDRVVVATKFGMIPSQQTLWKRAAKPFARALMRVAPAVRGFVRRQAAAEVMGHRFTLAILEESIEMSLRKLKTDHVDLLYMHAAPSTVLEDDALLRAMERLVQAGKVRATGISAHPEVIELVLERPPRPLQSIQFPCNVLNFWITEEEIAQARRSGLALVANNPFGGVDRVHHTRAALSRMAQSETTPAAIREKLARLEDGILADAVLNVIVKGTGIHVVVPAMMKPRHVKSNVDAVTRSRFSAEETNWLRSRLRERQRGGPLQD